MAVASNSKDGTGPSAGFQRVTPRISSASIEQTLTGLDYSIDGNWRGEPIDHDPFNLHMQWFFQRVRGKPHKRVVKVFVEGPLIDDPEPPSEFPGICLNLWDYEVFELFFANDKDQYLEVEVGPHGHWLVLMLNGKRNAFNKGEELELEVQNTFEGNVWRCNFEIPLAYFPPNVTKFNAYAIHGTDPDRHYEALYPVTDGTHDEPDFHRLEYFKPIDISRIIPSGFNDTPWNDLLYGDFWGPVCQ